MTKISGQRHENIIGGLFRLRKSATKDNTQSILQPYRIFFLGLLQVQRLAGVSCALFRLCVHLASSECVQPPQGR